MSTAPTTTIPASDEPFERAMAQTVDDNVQDIIDIIEAGTLHPGATTTVIVAHSVACVLFPLPYAMLGVMHASASAARGISGKRRR